jgi:hypothetical protein
MRATPNHRAYGGIHTWSITPRSENSDMFWFYSHIRTAKLQTIFLKTWGMFEIVNLKIIEGENGI